MAARTADGMEPKSAASSTTVSKGVYASQLSLQAETGDSARRLSVDSSCEPP